ncbi:MAG TPA: polysaccharide deacetylase family protein [Chitinophagaceae bacterium]|nr:polysaccharide deacetylase family protein [Chitinophagaceae bacterium]
MIVYAASITPRLQYMIRFAGQLLFEKIPELTTDKEKFIAWSGARINYSPTRIAGEEYQVVPHGLLDQQGITSQDLACFMVNDTKAFFKTAGDHPFDVFAAAFYLLSRYEEYGQHEKDIYGRYAHTNSLAFREGFLHEPVINQWCQQLAAQLKEKFPSLKLKKNTFSFVPSYDIDIAWSYRHKGWWRSTGGLIKSFFKGHWKDVAARVAVWRGRQKDPFDTYGLLNGWHEQYGLRPYYFFPAAEKRGKYDKNISPSKKALQALIQDHAIRYPIGLHPSWRSGDEPALLKKEKETLAAVSGTTITASRQHYIRFTLPSTYRHLLQEGIRFDFSMGYGSINGFRASACTPFYWYDLEKEEETELMLFPFCYMDANSFYEQRYTPAQALAEMLDYHKKVKEVNGLLITIWHNHFLGTDPLYTGWKEVYGEFLVLGS